MALPSPQSFERFTSDQKAALCIEHQRWLALRAGAGSGKTSVLVARFVLLIEEGIELEKIVAITFTRKAAHEMSNRVLKLLQERILELEAYLNLAQGDGTEDNQEEAFLKLQYLRKAYTLFHTHRITTIDSFCHAQLKHFFLEAGLSPGFEVLEENDRQELEEKVIQDFAEYCSLHLQSDGTKSKDQADETKHEVAAYIRLHDTLSFRSVRKILKWSLQNSSKLKGIFDAWGNFSERKNWEEYISQVQASAREAFQQTSQELRLAEQLESAAKVARQIQVQDPDNHLAHFVLRVYQKFMSESLKEEDLKLPRKGRGKIWKDSGFPAPQVTELKNELIQLLKGSEVEPRIEEENIELLKALAQVLPKLRQRYDEEKQGKLSFADLRDTFQSLLEQPQISQKVAQRITYLMIDEFQDTDQEQWQIFQNILRHDFTNLFIVGDDKQSIYRFRGADVSLFKKAQAFVVAHNQREQAKPLESLEESYGTPSLFEQYDREVPKAEVLPEKIAALKDGSIELATNFRSSFLPLELGNQLFNRVFSLKHNQSESYRKKEDFDASPAAMICGRSHQKHDQGTVDIIPFIESRSKRGSTTNLYSQQDSKEFQALLTARYVKQILIQKRQFRPEEIAVLTRTHGALDVLKQAFSQLEVDCQLSGGMGFFQQQEIRDLLALLAALHQPMEDLHILALFRSPYLGLSDNTIIHLFHIAKNQAHRLTLYRLWQKIVCDDFEHQHLMNEQERECLVLGYKYFAALRSLVGHTSLRCFLIEALQKFAAYSHWVEIGKEQRQSNLRRFIELADAYEKKHGSHFSAFVESILRRVMKDENEEEGKTGFLNRGVKLMTIHASKGKEFDAVVLPFLQGSGEVASSLFQVQPAHRVRQGQKPFLSIKPENIFSEQIAEHCLEPFAGRMLRAQNQREEAAEFRRLCYVAWTRAREHVGVVCALPEKSSELKTRRSERLSLQDIFLAGLGFPEQYGKTYQRDLQTFREKLDGLFGEAAPRVAVYRPRSIYVKALKILSQEEAQKQEKAFAYTYAKVVDDIQAADFPYLHALQQRTEEEIESGGNFSKQKLALERFLNKERMGGFEEKSGSFEMAFGTLVHAAFDVFLRSEKKQVSPQKLLERALKEWGLEDGRLSEDELKRVKRKALQHIARGVVFLSELSEQWKCRSELEITFMLYGYQLTRRLDLVLERQGGELKIVDYKTGRDKGRYKTQLRLYAIALKRQQELMGKPVEHIECGLFFTAQGKYQAVEKFNYQELCKLEKEVFFLE